ncbi:MAG TPA: DUF1697 domain-containing protein [Trueperaceae bacterium]
MSDDRLFVFLRAVNLGRVNKVPMKQLVAEADAAGLGECRYLLQSGNLIFPGFTRDPVGLKSALERLILDRFAVTTAAVTRKPRELRRLVEANPYETPEGGSIQVAMWDEEPDAEGLAELASGDYGEDLLCLTEGAAIIRYASSSHRSKLSNSLIERRWRVASTLRNIRTLERLLDV